MATCKTCGEPYLTEQPHRHPRKIQRRGCQHKTTYYDERGEKCKDCGVYLNDRR